jgi:hypothetical protein
MTSIRQVGTGDTLVMRRPVGDDEDQGAEAPSVIGDHRGFAPDPMGWGAIPQQPPQARRDLTSLGPGSLFFLRRNAAGEPAPAPDHRTRLH